MPTLNKGPFTLMCDPNRILIPITNFSYMVPDITFHKLTLGVPFTRIVTEITTCPLEQQNLKKLVLSLSPSPKPQHHQF